MPTHLLFVPFHLLALVVLVVGEVRAYSSHRNLWRAVGLPLGFVLVPVLAISVLGLVGAPRAVFLFRQLAQLGWPLAALVWGALQILREPSPQGAPRDRKVGGLSGGASEEAVRRPDPVNDPASLKALRALLFTGGLLGMMACLVALALFLIANYSLGGLRASGLWSWFVWMVNYFAYTWVVYRRWRAGRLIVVGIVVHAHLVFWVQRMHETADALPLVGVLLLGLLTYCAYTWLVWRRDEPASRARL